MTPPSTSPTARWYYGWNIVAAAAVITLLTVGMRMSIGPFFLPIAEDLGFTRTKLASIIALGMLFYGVGMPLAGYLVNRRSTRFVLLLGTVIVLASSVWSVMATGPVGFTLAFGVALSLGLAFTSPVALTPIISRWFARRRGMALFFLSTGSMAGIAIMTPVFSYCITNFSWQATLLGFAGLFALLTVPTALWVMRDQAPEGGDANRTQPSAAAGGSPHAALASASPFAQLRISDAIRTRPFWIVAFGLFTCGYSMNLLGTHGVPMLVDHGFDTLTASYSVGLIGLVAIFSTVILGRLSDIVPRKHILAAIYFIRGLGFFALLIVALRWELYAVAAIGGMVWAGSIALSSAILADIYGVKLVGVLYGWTYFGHQIGAMVSSWLGGWGYERYTTHWLSFGSAGILLLLAAAVSMRLPISGITALPRAAASAKA